MFEEIKNKFIEYIKINFNLEDPKISHKLNHTLYVVDNSEYLCQKLGLNKEEIKLAKLIALFHDFGRFYEAKQYKSFREDLIKMDHALIGTELLFKEGLIRDFIKEDKYDMVMEIAIANHSRFKLDITGMSKQEILHSKIIRDADKLDSFRNKAVTDIYLMSNITTEELETSVVSPKIYSDFMNEMPILDKDRKTGLDIWVSYIAFIFDIYFQESLDYIKEKDYINILINKYNYKLPEAAQQMVAIRTKANNYLNNKQ